MRGEDFDDDQLTAPLLAPDHEEAATTLPHSSRNPQLLSSSKKRSLGGGVVLLCAFCGLVACVASLSLLHRSSPYYSSPVSRAFRYVSRGLSTKNEVLPPADWVPAINNFDMVFNPNDDTSVRSDYMPLMGNGFLVQMLNSGTMFVHGVFNGQIDQGSSRASIPSPLMLVVGDSCLLPCLTMTHGALDFKKAVYHRTGYIHDTQGYIGFQQRYYTHRAIHSLIVVEIDFTFQIQFRDPVLIYLNKLVSKSNDVILKTISSPSDRTAVIGSTVTAEATFTNTTTFAIVCSTLPASVSLANNASYRFLCAVRHSLECGSTTEAGVLAAANNDFNRAMGMSNAELYQLHVNAWDELWDSGIEISSRDDVALAANATLFALLASSHPTLPFGLAPGGLNSGYGGHSFWDVETWMFPGLLLLHPPIAKSLTQYRFLRLHGAQLKAKSYTHHNWSGTMFPWESAVSGLEACSSGYPTGVYEQHISGDIAISMQQYWWVTRDVSWLEGVGGPVLRGIADFWTSRAETENGAQALGPKDNLNQTLHILNVIPPDEYHQGNDSIYTNVVAVLSLTFAIDSTKTLGTSGSDQNWMSVRDRLLLPYNDSLHIHPEYVGYDGSTIKQADVVLLSYPLGYRISDASHLSDLDYYSSRTDLGGPAMTWGMHAIGYKDLNQLDKANMYFNQSFHTHFDGGPYMVWSEAENGNGCPNFVTGAGGYLQTLVFGWPGIRITNGGLAVKPRVLPEAATYMKVRRFSYLASKFDLSFDSTITVLTMVVTDESALTVSIRVNNDLSSRSIILNTPLTFDNSDLLLMFADDAATVSIVQ